MLTENKYGEVITVENNENSVKEQTQIGPITYQKIFWLFIIGSLVGVPLEGFWCLIRYGRWETHVVTIWGPFCIIYGLGMAGCYIGAVLLKNKSIFIRFLAFALIGAAVEFICGIILEYGLHMKAWDYSDQLLNIKGHISLTMTLLWGALGIVFGFFVPLLEKGFRKIRGQGWKIACICLTVFMVIDLSMAAVCFVRWKGRHDGILPSNKFESWIDVTYDDDRMQNRFCEWWFIDE